MKTLLPSTELLGSSQIELHYHRPKLDSMHHITKVEDAHAFLRTYMNPKQMDLRESFWVIFMTNANRVIGISNVANGTTTGVQPNARYIFQLALLTNASAIIIAHNHPSGNLSPSTSDVKETKRIRQIAKALEITVLDHIIISSESYLSMAQEHKM